MKAGSAFAVIALVLAAGLASAACEDPQAVIRVPCDPPLTILVSPSNVALVVGGRAQVAAAVSGTCGHPNTVTWEMQDTATATVEAAPDSAGPSRAFVTGKAAGHTMLIVTATADITVKAAVAIMVAPSGPLD